MDLEGLRERIILSVKRSDWEKQRFSDREVRISGDYNSKSHKIREDTSLCTKRMKMIKSPMYDINKKFHISYMGDF